MRRHYWCSSTIANFRRPIFKR